jgi:hypothetical protein
MLCVFDWPPAGTVATCAPAADGRRQQHQNATERVRARGLIC